jgi:hypothetical protein
MDRAVELDPKNLGVRIPRGAVVLVTAPFVSEPTARRRARSATVGERR